MKGRITHVQHIPRQGSMLSLEWSASFPFTIVLLKMCKLSLESINATMVDGEK